MARRTASRRSSVIGPPPPGAPGTRYRRVPVYDLAARASRSAPVPRSGGPSVRAVQPLRLAELAHGLRLRALGGRGRVVLGLRLRLALRLALRLGCRLAHDTEGTSGPPIGQ